MCAPFFALTTPISVRSMEDLPSHIIRDVWYLVHNQRLWCSLRPIQAAGPGFWEDMPDLVDDPDTAGCSYASQPEQVYGYGRVQEILEKIHSAPS